MRHDTSRDLERRINLLLDGRLSEAEAAELEKELIRNPRANLLRQDYARGDEQVRRALDAILAPSAEEVCPTEAAVARSAASFSRWPAAAAATAAAALLLAAGAYLAWRADGTTSPTSPPKLVAHGEDERPAVEPAPPDTWQPPAEPDVPEHRVRRIDRYSVDVFDPQTQELRRLLVDQEQSQIQTVSLEL